MCTRGADEGIMMLETLASVRNTFFKKILLDNSDGFTKQEVVLIFANYCY